MLIRGSRRRLFTFKTGTCFVFWNPDILGYNLHFNPKYNSNSCWIVKEPLCMLLSPGLTLIGVLTNHLISPYFPPNTTSLIHLMHCSSIIFSIEIFSLLYASVVCYIVLLDSISLNEYIDLFIHLPMEEQLSYNPFVVILNKDATNIWEQIFIWGYTFISLR